MVSNVVWGKCLGPWIDAARDFVISVVILVVSRCFGAVVARGARESCTDLFLAR